MIQNDKEFQAYAAAWEQKIGSFLSLDWGRKPTVAGGALAGLPLGVKDNIAVKGLPLTCGSKMLEPLNSPYDATAVARLQAAGAVVVGKTNLDEFGMGSSTDNSALKQTNNPWNPAKVSGGSSGGSAAAVAAGLVPLALGSDTGGSIRQPAAFCGVYGLKPTYGTVSRFGLTAYASSLEVIGLCARDLSLMETTYDLMKGADENDQTSLNPDPASGRTVKTLGVLKGLSDLSPSVDKAYRRSLEVLKDLGYTLVEVTLPTLEYVVPVYYTIATAEASANLARFNGVRYGHRTVYSENPEELMRKSRGEGFGPEVKARILLGTYVLRSGFQDQYYHRAQKIRTALRRDLDAVFTQCDALYTPAFPTQAFGRGGDGLDPFQQKLADKFTVTANLAGVPGLSFPVAVEDGLPVGMQVLAPVFEEARLFSVARRYAEAFAVPEAPGFRNWWGK